ncbi:unnamed protein product [Prunus brigantina]
MIKQLISHPQTLFPMNQTHLRDTLLTSGNGIIRNLKKTGRAAKVVKVVINHVSKIDPIEIPHIPNLPLEPSASWFSPKCIEVQQLTRHLRVKHCFGASHESGIKSKQTLNTRYDLKITRV